MLKHTLSHQNSVANLFGKLEIFGGFENQNDGGPECKVSKRLAFAKARLLVAFKNLFGIDEPPLGAWVRDVAVPPLPGGLVRLEVRIEDIGVLEVDRAHVGRTDGRHAEEPVIPLAKPCYPFV